MATILAALMAACESADRPVSGQDFGAALAAAVDVAATLGVAAKSPLKFFRPANAGIFGATLGIARLYRLSREQAGNALGFALSFCAGTMQAHSEGKPALPIQIGQAARNAVLAARLGAHGLEAAQDSLEGPYGYFSLFEDRYDIDGLAEALGRIWRITEVSHKPFPTGRAAQGGIMLMQSAKKAGILPGDVRHAVLHAPPLIKRLVGRPAYVGMAPSHARLCFPYCGAVALISGEVDLTDFTPAALSRPDMLEVSSRIDVRENGVPSASAFTPQRLELQLGSEEVVHFDTDHLPGSPASPLSDAENLAKFRSCVAFGFGRGRPNPADQIIAAVERLDELEDAAMLSRLAAGYMEQSGDRRA
jgi:2-methylcitrate dehydratase PrpD